MLQLNRLREAMAKARHELVMLTQPTNIFWLTGFTGSFAQILVSEEKAIFITDSRYTIQAQEQVTGFDIATFASPTTGIQFLKQQLNALGARSVAYESMFVTVHQLEQWKSNLEGIDLTSLGDLVENLRMVKSEAEVDKIASACALTDAGFDHILRLVQPGVSEFEIQLELEFFFRRHGASMAFEPIIVSGANSARPHGKASEKLLEVGDLVTFDFGAKLEGYCADMTRTVVVGKADSRTREIYAQVLKAQLACLDMLKPGVVAEDVDAKARAIFDEKGWAKHFGHGLGHGLGILVHDTGRLGVGSKTVLEPGQIWTIEPGIYFEGFGGCRIEDDVVITESGKRIFNNSTKELLELPSS
jgi:Xaa-Pro aminopeptidase